MLKLYEVYGGSQKLLKKTRKHALRYLLLWQLPLFLRTRGDREAQSNTLAQAKQEFKSNKETIEETLVLAWIFLCACCVSPMRNGRLKTTFTSSVNEKNYNGSERGSRLCDLQRFDGNILNVHRWDFGEESNSTKKSVDKKNQKRQLTYLEFDVLWPS